MAQNENAQIKSRNRVSRFGEVFTAEREVNAMLDLVKEETNRIDSTFLEPSCGNGNFLVEILRRKLNTAGKQKYMYHCDKREEILGDLSLLVVSSIYGIDIMQDNVDESHAKMLSELCEWYEKETRGLYPLRNGVEGLKPSAELIKAWNYILDYNIQRGDFLTMQHPDSHEPIVIRQWNISGKTVNYTDHNLGDLIHEQEPKQLLLW